MASRFEARILDAGEARAIYDEIVRRMRDPALLEYVGAGAIQASVFPIQPRSEVKIEFEYAQLLPAENGLIHYQYPLRTDQFTRQPVERLSLSLSVTSRDPIGAVYSPTHDLASCATATSPFAPGSKPLARARRPTSACTTGWRPRRSAPTCWPTARAPTKTALSR